MRAETLKYIDDILTGLDVPYAFMEWCDEPPDVYFVGEYQETEPANEDGEMETSFIVTGFTRGSWSSLHTIKEKIEKQIDRSAILDSGTGVAVFYGSSYPVQTGDAELKRIQINLKIKEWRVN